ncbi:MAG: hypothetical protein Q9170_005321 [Blastenia crenularia]
MPPLTELLDHDTHPMSNQKAPTETGYEEAVKNKKEEDVLHNGGARKSSKSSRSRTAVSGWKPKPKDACQPLVRSYLNRLPSEILTMICRELWEGDMPALRLQCKYLCEVATPRFLRSIDVRFKKTSIDALLQLSKHSVLSQNVETIRYEPNLLRRESRQEWEKGIPLRLCCDDANIPPPLKLSASKREWPSFHRALKKAIRLEERESYTQEELDIAWPIYQKYLREQDELIGSDYGCQDLYQAIRCFPNLTAVHVNFAYGLWFGDTSVRPYGDGLCHAHGHCDPGQTPGLNQIASLVKMLGKSEVQLNSLRIGSINWKFFQGCTDNDNGCGELFNAFRNILKPLHDLKLEITTCNDWIEDDDDQLYEIAERHAFLENGLFDSMLSNATDLRKFSIAFENYEINCPINFHNLVMDTHWPHLHTIKLDSVETHEDTWIRFFERHAKTIKHIQLGVIRLVEGEWPYVLERMQQLLALEEAHFQHDLCGDNPEQWWRLDPPGYTSSKDDSVQENRTRWALEKFMVDGGACPLRDEEEYPQVPVRYRY